MQLTKFDHACFVLEKDSQQLLVDPGNFTDNFMMPENLVGVAITHLHPDHCDEAKLQDIRKVFPGIPIYVHKTVAETLPEDLGLTLVEPGEVRTCGAFTVRFGGGRHAVIHPSLPEVVNLTLLINDNVYYPGDSFDLPTEKVDMILVPVAAPWLKISETMDFLSTTRPTFAIPTHDAILSDKGKGLVDARLSETVEQYGGQYRRLGSGETISL